jgi:hypothetical protein
MMLRKVQIIFLTILPMGVEVTQLKFLAINLHPIESIEEVSRRFIGSELDNKFAESY